MQNSFSTKIIPRQSKIMGKAALKHLEYFNPKGASNRKLPLNCRRTFFELAVICSKPLSENASPEKLENLKPVQKSLKNHTDLAKSTKVLSKIDLVSSREGSPVKLAPILNNFRDLTPQPSLPRLEQITEIVDSCEKIYKLNKSDMIIANDLGKEGKNVFKNAEDFVDERRNVRTRQKWNEYFLKKKPNKQSIDKLKKESFETAYFVERKLRKNTVKKLKEKIMPWKSLKKK